MTTVKDRASAKPLPSTSSAVRSEWASALELVTAYSAADNWREDGAPVRVIRQDEAVALVGMIEQLLTARFALASTLKAARQQFAEEQGSGESGRVSTCGALLALINYVKATDAAAEGQLLPISLLLAAVIGLEQGRALDPLLAPRSKDGRPSSSLSHAVLEQYTAAAISILLDDKRFDPAGPREPAAVQHVQRLFARLDHPLSVHALRRWRALTTAALPRGFGKPEKPDRVHPTPALATRVYVKVWREWRVLKGRMPATKFLEQLITPALAPLLPSAGRVGK